MDWFDIFGRVSAGTTEQKPLAQSQGARMFRRRTVGISAILPCTTESLSGAGFIVLELLATKAQSITRLNNLKQLLASSGLCM